jgi:hypothetical protein
MSQPRMARQTVAELWNSRPKSQQQLADEAHMEPSWQDPYAIRVETDGPAP